MTASFPLALRLLVVSIYPSTRMNRRPASLPKSPLNTRVFLRRALTRASAAASAALLFAGHSAKAANGADTWVGNTSTDWAGMNWMGTNNPPISGDSLVFGADGTAGAATTPVANTLTNTLTSATFNIAGITFSSAAPAYTMTGNTFNLTAGITNNSGVLQTFSNTGGLFTSVGTTYATGTGGVSLSGLTFVGGGQTTTVTGAGGLSIAALTLNNGARVNQTFSGAGNVTIGSIAPGTGGNSTLTYAGTGTLTVNGVSSINSSNTQDAVTSGTFLLASGGSISQGISSSGSGTFTENAGGVLTGGGPVTQGSSTTMTLAGANTYTGATTVNAGTLLLSGSINPTNATTGSSVTVNGGAFNESSTGVLYGSGGGGTAGGQITLNAGAVDLQGANKTTGNVTVNGGTFTVDSTGGTTANVLQTNGTSLTMGNGTTNFLLSANATANTETLYQTAFTANTSSLVEVTQNGNTGTGGIINLGNAVAFGRNAASITDFGTLPTGGTVLENTSSKANSLNGVLASSTTGVAFATVGGGTNFATISATTGAIGTLAPVAGTYGATANVSVTGGDAPASGAGANTLTFAGTTGATLTLTGTNTITAGGILITPSTTGATTITGGTITAGAGKELVFINNEPNTAGSLTVSSTIADSTSGSSALTIGSTLGAAGIAAAPQRTILTAANTFTGLTTLLNGTLNLSNQLALQSSTLQPNVGTTVVFDQSVTGNAFTLGGLAGSGNIALLNNATTPAAIALTLNVATGNAPQYNGVLSGAGATLTKTGAGTETLGGANTYTGVTTINGGTLQLGNSGAGKILTTSGVVTASGATLSFGEGNSGGSESGLMGGVVSGVGGITDNEGNQNITLTLDKANTYTGPTVVLQRGSLTSTVAPVYDANGNMISSGFGVNSALVFNAPTANAGETVFLSTNSQVGSLSTGATTVAASSGNGIVLNNFNLIIGSDNTSTTFNAQISGAAIPNGGTTTATRNFGGNLTKIGTGTQTLGGANLYSGTTTITGGTLAVTTLANGGITTTGSITSATNQLTVANATGLAVGQVIQSPALAGSAETITAINGNVLTLSGNASTTLTNGSIVGGAGNGLGISTNAASNLVLDGGALQYNGTTVGSTDRLFQIGQSTDTVAATGTLDSSSVTADTLTFSNAGSITFGKANLADNLTLTGTNTGANTLTPVLGDNGTGVVSLTKNGVGSWTLAGANTYSGGTTVNAGTLTVGTAGSLGAATGTLAVNNPNTGAGTATVLNLSTATPTTVGTLSGTLATPSSGTNTATINNGGQLLTVNATTPGSFAGTIAGSGGLTSGGTSIQTLTGANTYSGATTVNAGTLLYNGSLTPAAAGAGTTVTVGSTATLGGTGLLTVTSVTVNQNGTLSPGATVGATTGTLTLNTTGGLTINGTLAIGIAGSGGTSLATNGALTLGSASTLTLSAAPDGTDNYLIAKYGTTESGTFMNFTVPNGYTINYAGADFGGGPDIELDPVAVPEPSTLWAGALMLVGAGWYYRRRRA